MSWQDYDRLSGQLLCSGREKHSGATPEGGRDSPKVDPVQDEMDPPFRRLELRDLDSQVLSVL